MDQGSFTKQATDPFLFVFDTPRSCSNLFGKLLSTHPRLYHVQRPYLLAASRGPERINAGVSAATQQRFVAKRKEVPEEITERWEKMTYADANAKLTAEVESAQSQGKIAVAQEHAALCMMPDVVHAHLNNPETNCSAPVQTNPTVLRNDLMRRCVPIVLMRHPALSVPSCYRMHRKENMLNIDDGAFQWWISLRWIRLVHEYFGPLAGCNQCTDGKGLRRPIVIDANDVVHDTTNTMVKLCSAVGIDPDGIQQTWQSSENGEIPEGAIRSFREPFLRSTGVARNGGNVKVDLDSATREWSDEFGNHIAEVIRSKVDAEMETYWHLRSRRL